MIMRRLVIVTAVVFSTALLPRCSREPEEKKEAEKPARGNQPPNAVSVTPASGSSSSQAFSYSFSDPDGAADMIAAQILINATLSPPKSCYMHIEPGSSRLWLVKDSGTGSTGPITLGKSGSLENAQCLVDAAGSSVSTSGDNLTVNLALTFKPAFKGEKVNFMTVSDTKNQTPGWQARGKWTVP